MGDSMLGHFFNLFEINIRSRGRAWITKAILVRERLYFYFLNPQAFFGTDFEVGQITFLCSFLSFFIRDLSLIHRININFPTDCERELVYNHYGVLYMLPTHLHLEILEGKYYFVYQTTKFNIFPQVIMGPINSHQYSIHIYWYICGSYVNFIVNFVTSLILSLSLMRMLVRGRGYLSLTKDLYRIGVILGFEINFF
jgi:hypothetical protein